jgi:hypothetical protein
MAKFRKKPVVIEAVQWGGKYGEPPCVERPGPGLEHLLPVDGLLNTGIIKTLEGDMIVREGEWVITGVKGENYPCKDEIFRATYEPVELS